MKLTQEDVIKLMKDMVSTIQLKRGGTKIFGVPRGGTHVAYLMVNYFRAFEVVYSEAEADIIVDDIIDSGATKAKFSKPFYALVTKTSSDWIIFPWECDEVGSQEDIITRQLQAIGEDPKRDGLLDTPKRVIKSWKEIYGGYEMNPEEILSRVFENEQRYDEMVISREIDFFSTCEHHLMPFFGQAHIAYIPKDKIVGLSKLSRLVECFARRLQVQERMTQQIANAIQDSLNPLGVAVYIEGKHLCQISRGIQKQNSVMVTSALKGVFQQPATRAEFISLCKSRS